MGGIWATCEGKQLSSHPQNQPSHPVHRPQSHENTCPETHTDVRRGCTHHSPKLEIHSPNAECPPRARELCVEHQVQHRPAIEKLTPVHTARTGLRNTTGGQQPTEERTWQFPLWSHAQGAKVSPGDERQPGWSEEWGPLQAARDGRQDGSTDRGFHYRREERPKLRVTRSTERPCTYVREVFTQSKTANTH